MALLSKNKDNDINNKKHVAIISGLLLVGLCIRYFPFAYKNIINPDGALYINQAKAILNGEWELAIKCGFEFISLYHLLIPLLYKIFGDWIIAAKVISLIFGTLAIIPFYLILNQFFRLKTAIMASLAFAINPFLVSHSEDIIKDPISWFFSLLGVLFFVTFYNKKSKSLLLFLSSLSFLLAGWARFEIITYVIGSILYILFSKGKKAANLFFFCIPIVILLLTALIGAKIYKADFSIWSFYLGPRVMIFVNNFLEDVLGGNILAKTTSALVLLTLRISRACYIPFLLLLIPGLWTVRDEIKRNRQFSYFILLSSISFFALFASYLKSETLVDRYAAFIVIPIFVFMGSGIETIKHYFKDRKFNEKNIIRALYFYIFIIVIAFPQNLVHKRLDQIIYEDIGKYISRVERNQPVKIMAPDPRIVFFANLFSSEIKCVKNNLNSYYNLSNSNYSEMISFFKEKNFKYFLWESRRWKNRNFNFFKVAKPEDLQEIKRWETNERKLILYKVL